jgi:hypothetical protein
MERAKSTSRSRQDASMFRQSCRQGSIGNSEKMSATSRKGRVTRMNSLRRLGGFGMPHWKFVSGHSQLMDSCFLHWVPDSPGTGTTFLEDQDTMKPWLLQTCVVAIPTFFCRTGNRRTRIIGFRYVNDATELDLPTLSSLRQLTDPISLPATAQLILDKTRSRISSVQVWSSLALSAFPWPSANSIPEKKNLTT